MGFNRDVLHRRRDQLNEWGVRVRWAGRKPRLWASVIKELQFAEQLTAGNDVLTLTMCVNYGGRNELVGRRARDRRRRRGRPAEAVRHHGEDRSRSTCTCPTCPTSTSSCAARGSSARPTSCSGSPRTPRWCSSTRCGPTSAAPTCGARSSSTSAATAASAARTTRRPPETQDSCAGAVHNARLASCRSAPRW